MQLLSSMETAVIQHGSSCYPTWHQLWSLTWKQLWSNIEIIIPQLHTMRSLVSGQLYLANQYLVVASSASYWSIRRQLSQIWSYWFKAPSCDQNTRQSACWTLGMAVKTTVNNWSWKIEGWGLESCFVKLRQLFRAGIQVQSPCLIFADLSQLRQRGGSAISSKASACRGKGTSHPFSYGECCTVYIQKKHHMKCMKWLAPQKNTNEDCTAKML